jgi:methionyl-tRNA formyltransferase
MIGWSLPGKRQIWNGEIFNNTMKIIFIGTPEFGAIILEGLTKGGYKPVLVITETDKPVGRKQIITPPPVKTAALNYGIEVLQPEKISECEMKIKKMSPDLIIVAAYGQLIGKTILEIPKYGCLNVHPSLLPKYRGASPIQGAILSGELQTGVSIMLLDEKMDHGPVIAQEEVAISGNDDAKTLSDKLFRAGSNLLVKTIPDWFSGKLKAILQEEEKATYTKILGRIDGKINWSMTAKEIERQVRAYIIWPNSFTECQENKFGIKKIKIWKVKIQEQDKNCPIGSVGKTFMATNEEIAVQTGKDFLIIEELQPEGGKRMTSAEFLNGRSDFIGTILI